MAEHGVQTPQDSEPLLHTQGYGEQEDDDEEEILNDESRYGLPLLSTPTPEQ